MAIPIAHVKYVAKALTLPTMEPNCMDNASRRSDQNYRKVVAAIEFLRACEGQEHIHNVINIIEKYSLHPMSQVEIRKHFDEFKRIEAV
jgi:hypothetical protein